MPCLVINIFFNPKSSLKHHSTSKKVDKSCHKTFINVTTEHNKAGTLAYLTVKPKCLVLDGHGRNCRFKRDISAKEVNQVDVVLETAAPIFSAQPNPSLVTLHLQKSTSNIIASNFKFFVRDGDDLVQRNTTRKVSDCLFSGGIKGDSPSQVSLSLCGREEFKGLVLTEDKSFVIRSIKGNKTRVKRDEFGQEREKVLVVMTENEGLSSQCGIKKTNLARMKAPQQDIMGIHETPEEEHFERRFKRDTGRQKAIELAVFVDDELYENVRRSGRDVNPEDDIYEMVFTYLNAVQLLYNSDRLNTKFRILLVVLEIQKNERMDKRGGDIEGYLDSFCLWQKGQNKNRKQYPDKWDHGLMLTGMDLYDENPDENGVIGLAWVSGMCHERYSCTINEGNNFESVFVIAHEMGHNLGMNHDGEKSEGNYCDSERYLMSPLLGPGKVSWSQCSSEELDKFLLGVTSKTRYQSSCLNDVPKATKTLDYLKDDSVLPGETVNAKKQCQKSYSKKHFPYVTSKHPYENMCRELWCTNGTHALRAHPALEGTGCRSTPYPYGSHCIEGKCVPYTPNGVDPVSADNDVDGESSDKDTDTPSLLFAKGDRPLWYDPLFAEIFDDLRKKVSENYATNDEL